MQAIEQQLLIREEQIIKPLTQVLDAIAPSTLPRPIEPPSITIKKSLDELFPEQQYDEKNIQKAKEVLDPLANKFTEGELRDTVAEVQYLVNSWLDDFEKEIFNGLTLQELLHEKGSA